MGQYMRTEIFKLIHKKEFYIIYLCVFILIFLFAFLVGNDSSVIQASINSIGGGFFIVFISDFFSTVFIWQLLSIVFVTSIWSKEIFDYTIQQSIVIIGNRMTVYKSKLIIQSFVIGLLYLIMMLVSGLLFEMVCKDAACYSNDFFNIIGDRLGIYLAINFFYILFFSNVVMLLSMKFESIKTLLISVVVLVAVRMLERVDVIKNYIPSYFGTSSYIFSEDVSGEDLFIRLILLVVLTIVCILVGRWILKRREF